MSPQDYVLIGSEIIAAFFGSLFLFLIGLIIALALLGVAFDKTPTIINVSLPEEFTLRLVKVDESQEP